MLAQNIPAPTFTTATPPLSVQAVSPPALLLPLPHPSDFPCFPLPEGERESHCTPLPRRLSHSRLEGNIKREEVSKIWSITRAEISTTKSTNTSLADSPFLLIYYFITLLSSHIGSPVGAMHMGCTQSMQILHIISLT